MPTFPTRVTLGQSGLSVGPLAVSGGYGVDAASLRRAFDRGVNCFYHGSLRKPGMTAAIRELVAAGKRDQLVIVLQSYTRWAPWLERSLRKGLSLLGIDHADVLLLGWFNGMPGAGLLDRAERLRSGGLFRHLAISGHNRRAFVRFAADPRFDILHVRYNAAHVGAESEIFPRLPPDRRPGVVAYTATSWGKLLRADKMPRGEAPLRGRDCYRFVLSSPHVDVCMTGPRNAREMDEALATLDEGPLSAEEDERIRRIGQHVHG